MSGVLILATSQKELGKVIDTLLMYLTRHFVWLLLN
jgi:hypothetical protein